MALKATRKPENQPPLVLIVGQTDRLTLYRAEFKEWCGLAYGRSEWFIATGYFLNGHGLYFSLLVIRLQNNLAATFNGWSIPPARCTIPVLTTAA
jgi:hypothetical protein